MAALDNTHLQLPVENFFYLEIPKYLKQRIKEWIKLYMKSHYYVNLIVKLLLIDPVKLLGSYFCLDNDII